MKRLFLALLAVLAFAAPASAIVGGPWDSNISGNPIPINPSKIGGTYQGTIKGKNLAGIMRFVTSPDGTGSVAGYSVTVRTGTGAQSTVTTTNYPATVTGYAIAFFEGTSASAIVDVVIDLGNRKIAGTIDGNGIRNLTQTLTRPATATSPEAMWEIGNSIYFNGSFSANLSKNWAANSFVGKGWLLVKKVDFDGFYAQLITNPTGATPQIVTAPMPFKVAGVKTSDTMASFVGSVSTPVDPQITQIEP